MTERSTLRERAREFRQREIVRAAARLLSRTGCRAFTMDALAREVGVSKATLYALFRSRDELISRVVGEGMAALSAELRSSGRPGQRVPRDQAVRKLLRYCLPSGRRDPPLLCCLAEVECPFADWDDLDRLLELPGDPSPARHRVGRARVVRAVAAVALHRARSTAGGRLPASEAILGHLRI